MSNGLLLLDVDGPLNPYAAKPSRRPDGYTTHRLRPLGWEHARKPLRVWLAPAHGPMLLDFSKTHELEMVWATTWQDDANRMIGPVIGMPELPVIRFDRHPGTLKGWKFPAVASYADGRPLAWLDDDFRHPSYIHAITEFQTGRGSTPTLLHHVDPAIGLTDADLDVVGSWFRTLVHP